MPLLTRHWITRTLIYGTLFTSLLANVENATCVIKKQFQNNTISRKYFWQRPQNQMMMTTDYCKFPLYVYIFPKRDGFLSKRYDNLNNLYISKI